MLIKNFTLKIIFFCLPLIFLSNCADSSKSSSVSTNVFTSAGPAVTVTPLPFSGQEATVRGENSAIKITDDLKTSVEQQEFPSVWLEFERENGTVSRIELDNKLDKNFQSDGAALFRYLYVIHHSESPDEKANAEYICLQSVTKLRNEIRQSKMDLPNGREKLTDDEIEAILSKQAGLIHDRYYELDDHFYPKSNFYRFKQSINEKLGHQIF